MRRCFRKFLKERPNKISEKSAIKLGPAELKKLGRKKKKKRKTAYFPLGI